MKVTHLYHSGILFETENKQIFVDAITDINQHIDFSKEIYFFATHVHSDHFDPVIFSYQGGTVHYVLSDDIKAHPDKNYMRVRPNEEYTLEDMRIFTFGSTDCGVSFIIQVEGYTLLHAGDLNWWHWKNDSQSVQLQEEKAFTAIVNEMPNFTYDVVCIPVDPRLEGAFHLAADYILDTLEVKHLVPIHFRTHFEVCEELYKHRHKDERVVRVTGKDQKVLDI